MAQLTRPQLQEMYTLLEKARQFETRAMELYMDGELPGFLHLSIGEEACGVGVCAALHQDDYISTTHRGHSHVIAKGGELKRMMAELYGRQAGYGHGKSGSMHIMDRELGILGANGITGGGIPIATGAGLSAQIRGSGQVAVAFFGDGSSNEGSFHESANMAAMWKLPVIFACENNQFAESTPQTYHQAIANIADRAVAYGMFAAIADGNDVIDVYEKTAQAVARARNGEGPTLLELKTYRVMGHYVGDPAVYRPKEVALEWRNARDPLALFRARLLASGEFQEPELDAIRDAVAAELEEAITFSRNAPLPPVESAFEDVYA